MQRHSPEFSKRLAHYGVAQVGHDKIHITDPSPGIRITARLPSRRSRPMTWTS